MALIYVATTGSDASSGAVNSPLKSITKAAQLAQPGDTILVHGGVYNGLVEINKNGTAAAPITIKAVDGARPIIDGTDTPANTHLVTIGGDHVTFQGFEVRNSAHSGIMTWNAHDVKILDNKVHDSKHHGIFALGGDNVSSYNTLIEGNEVWNNCLDNADRSGGWAQALSVQKSDYSTIRNNYVHENYGEGIDAISSKGVQILNNRVHDSFSVNIYLDNAQDAVVQGNTVYHTYKEQFHTQWGTATGILVANEYTERMLPSSGITITNNTVVGTVSYGSNFGANTGLVNSTISPNTLLTSPDSIINGTAPTPTPTPTDPAPAPVVDGLVTKVGTGSDTLTLKISQDAYQGDSQYVVTVDGKQVGGTFTAKALHGSGKFDTLEIKGNWGVGNHTVGVRLTNDLWGGTATTDRNVYLEKASYNGVDVPNSMLSLLANETKSFTVADTTAAPAPTPTTGQNLYFGAGSDALTIKFTQDAYKGDSKFMVMVDGRAVGGEFTAKALHNSGIQDTLTVKGDWGVGNHTVGIKMTNDLYGGTATTDRNIYVEKAIYNGLDVPNSARFVNSNKVKNFTLNDTTEIPSTWDWIV